MEEEQVESKSLADLAKIILEARKVGIRLVLIGGYAVAAYTRGYRYTKDIDLATDKPAVGRLKSLLRSLGYSIRDTEFGLAGSRRLGHDFIDLHISVGKIRDISTNREYPADSILFKNARRLKLRGYYSKISSLKAPVVDLETLLVLKLMTIGRQKDKVDVFSLLLDKRDEINLTLLADRVRNADLKTHLLNQVRDYARRLRDGELDKTWFSLTASRLPQVERREILKFLSKSANLLRQP